jgi:nucleotide-binding universal stress UspA family protein
MRVLVPVDASPYSEVVLNFIAQKGANFGDKSHFYVLNVYQKTIFESLFGKEALDKTLREDAMEIIDPAVERLRRSGVDAEGIFDFGAVADTINHFAEEKNADLIVMGSRGKGSVAGITFGSVTNSLLALTFKPMLILRDKPVNFRDSPWIGIAVDGSVYSATAVDFLVNNMKMFGGVPRIDLIHVVEQSAPGMKYHPLEIESMADRKEEIRDVFDDARTRLEAAGAEVRCHLLTDDEAGDAIADFSDEEDLDLIVIGTRGRGAFTASVLGSTSTRIAAVSDKPLLVIQTDESKLPPIEG